MQIPEWIILNNQIIDKNGNLKDLSKDKEATRSYFINNVNRKTQFFHSLKEKLDYLTENEYYESEFLEKYSYEQIKEVYDIAYSYKFRFPSYTGAYKFYSDYALKSKDGSMILERYEDRMSVIALYHADGNIDVARKLIHRLMNQDFTPATPTLLNTGRKHRGEFVSCFEITVDDSLNSIGRILEQSMHLSKMGGGVSINLNNLRAKTEPIKGVEGVSKGVVGVGKLLDNAFRYADQMGQRTGAGAVYLNIFHPDAEDLLNTKKLNADEDIRYKTLSIGIGIPNKFVQLAKENKDMYQFYPYTVFKEYGVEFDEVTTNMDKWYDILLDNPKVRKRKVNPRKLLEDIAATQSQSGYPYIFYTDNVNEQNPLEDKIKFSNLCTEILQPTTTSKYADYNKREDDVIGMGVSCNLSSLHITNVMKNNSIKDTVFAAMDIMTSVSHKTNIELVPEVAKANKLNRSVGLGAMGLHGFLAEKYIVYGSDESIDFVDVFFNIVNYYTLVYSMNKAKETGQTFYKFEKSKYADGTYFDGRGQILPTQDKVKELFKDVYIPTDEDWAKIKKDVMKYGLYHSHRLAVAPNGSIGYVMSATPSLTPVKQLIEERTYGKSKTYYPVPKLDEVGFMYQTSYTMNKYKVIDLMATIQKHIDQGISFELNVTSDTTSKELQRLYLYAHHKGLKTLYYTRTKKLSIQECEACAI